MGGFAAVNLLLDTHIFLWSLLEPQRLGKEAAAVLEDPQNTLWLSPVSVWECLILAEKGRITLQDAPASWIKRVFAEIPFNEAPLNFSVAIQSRLINLPHQDPADHFIVATSQVHDLTLITADARLLSCSDITCISGSV